MKTWVSSFLTAHGQHIGLFLLPGDGPWDWRWESYVLHQPSTSRISKVRAEWSKVKMTGQPTCMSMTISFYQSKQGNAIHFPFWPDCDCTQNTVFILTLIQGGSKRDRANPVLHWPRGGYWLSSQSQGWYLKTKNHLSSAHIQNHRQLRVTGKP